MIPLAEAEKMFSSGYRFKEWFKRTFNLHHWYDWVDYGSRENIESKRDEEESLRLEPFDMFLLLLALIPFVGIVGDLWLLLRCLQKGRTYLAFIVITSSLASSLLTLRAFDLGVIPKLFYLIDDFRHQELKVPFKTEKDKYERLKELIQKFIIFLKNIDDVDTCNPPFDLPPDNLAENNDIPLPYFDKSNNTYCGVDKLPGENAPSNICEENTKKFILKRNDATKRINENNDKLLEEALGGRKDILDKLRKLDHLKLGPVAKRISSSSPSCPDPKIPEFKGGSYSRKPYRLKKNNTLDDFCDIFK